MLHLHRWSKWSEPQEKVRTEWKGFAQGLWYAREVTIKTSVQTRTCTRCGKQQVQPVQMKGAAR